MTNVLWPTIRKFNHFLKWFHAVLYTALENHVPLPRFPETFSMWYRIVFGTKWHRFHYCCNLWWVQPLYCINTLDYNPCQWKGHRAYASFDRQMQETVSGWYVTDFKVICKGHIRYSFIEKWTNYIHEIDTNIMPYWIIHSKLKIASNK